jgi:hypothetical protein
MLKVRVSAVASSESPTLLKTIRADSPMPPMRPLPVRHLFKSPQDETTLCGHRFGPGDTVEDSEIDPGSVACDKCVTKASNS